MQTIFLVQNVRTFILGVLTLPSIVRLSKPRQICRVQEEGVEMRLGNAEMLRVRGMKRVLAENRSVEINPVAQWDPQSPMQQPTPISMQHKSVTYAACGIITTHN